MKENLNKTPLGENKSGVSVANSNFNQQPINKGTITIKGTLTSRIEVKPSADIPAYGFFNFNNQEKGIPVIFRIKDVVDKWLKPIISKGSHCELTGEWKHSKSSERPSFTCYYYEIIQEPKPLSSSELINLTQSLLNTTLEKYKEWTNRKDFLFKKLEELKEIETFTKLGSKFLDAYLIFKQASYANYQTKLLATNFDLTHYLTNISQEIHLVKSHIEAYQVKQLSHE